LSEGARNALHNLGYVEYLDFIRSSEQCYTYLNGFKRAERRMKKQFNSGEYTEILVELDTFFNKWIECLEKSEDGESYDVLCTTFNRPCMPHTPPPSHPRTPPPPTTPPRTCFEELKAKRERYRKRMERLEEEHERLWHEPQQDWFLALKGPPNKTSLSVGARNALHSLDKVDMSTVSSAKKSQKMMRSKFHTDKRHFNSEYYTELDDYFAGWIEYLKVQENDMFTGYTVHSRYTHTTTPSAQPPAPASTPAVPTSPPVPTQQVGVHEMNGNQDGAVHPHVNSDSKSSPNSNSDNEFASSAICDSENNAKCIYAALIARLDSNERLGAFLEQEMEQDRLQEFCMASYKAEMSGFHRMSRSTLARDVLYARLFEKMFPQNKRGDKTKFHQIVCQMFRQRHLEGSGTQQRIC
jgi:hypothetical protein